MRHRVVVRRSLTLDACRHWLSKQPAYSRSREFDVDSTSGNTSGLPEAEDEEEEDASDLGRRKRSISFLPSLGESTRLLFWGAY